MFKGILLTLSACFIWGLIFVIPTFLNEFSSLEIALGRYFFFGVISLFFFGGVCFRKLINYSLEIWIKALLFALIANILYYTCLVFAVQYANAAIATLIAGIAPVVIAFYGNWKENGSSCNKLILPALLIIAGLITVNVEDLFGQEPLTFSYEYVLGLVCAFLALLFWSWYVVANTQFLKECPSMSYFEWSTMLGVATFFWVMLALLLTLVFLDLSHLQKFVQITDELKLFFALTAILGCLCSWLGSYLWNSGCTLIPMSLGGQMTIFETLFGLSFVYFVDQRLPTYLECCGIILMLAAIVYSMNIFSKISTEPVHG